MRPTATIQETARRDASPTSSADTVCESVGRSPPPPQYRYPQSVPPARRPAPLIRVAERSTVYDDYGTPVNPISEYTKVH